MNICCGIDGVKGEIYSTTDFFFNSLLFFIMSLCKQMACEHFCMLFMVLAFCITDAFEYIRKTKETVFCYH